MSNQPYDGIVVLLVVLAFVAVYATPSVIAFWRRHPNRWLIAVINIVFGGTLLGWLIALVWALKAFHVDDAQSRGGESGLNLFINDPKKIEILSSAVASPIPAAIAASSLAAELEKLHRLLQQGIITQMEFDVMKARLLSLQPD